jgi:uncharacterized protein
MVKKILIALILLYKRYISVWMPPTCRFTPTCSVYAVEAIREYGALRGSLMAAWRIMRCNPFCRGGYDPVVPRAPGVR